LSIAGTALAIVICGTLLLVLGAIIRFSFLGAARRSGWEQRLENPQRANVEVKWGVRLPESLETYFQSETVRRSDFYFAPIGTKKSECWYIERFLPLTPRDVSEWISATNVPGIPIAIDASKGTYYLPFESLRQQKSPVLLRLPGRKRNEVKVASTFDEFVRFEPKAVPKDE
jgi:hypothetical protein